MTGTTLPDEVLEILLTEDLAAAEGFTLLLLTVRDDGWPHQAMIGIGEVVALDATRLALAVWPDSTTTRNLTARRCATLTCVVPPTSYALRLTCDRLADLEVGEPPLARFEAVVNEVMVDHAPYAELVTGVRYRLVRPTETVPRWAETRASLRRG